MGAKFGFYKVATGNILTKVGDVSKNKESILNLIKEAKKEKANVLTFGELSLTGYTLGDLLLNNNLMKEVELALKEIIPTIPNDLIVFIGGPFTYLNRTFNVTYVINDSKLVGIVPKSYLPSYNEFYEKRWFISGKEANFNEVEFLGNKVKFGNDLIFDGGDIKLGAEICEDLWVITPPSNNLSLNGANVIVNLSASNETISKKEYRKELVKSHSAKLYVGYIYSSSGFGESSQDLVYSGHQLIYSSGRLINETYDEKVLTIGLIDIEEINNDRNKHASSFECPIEKETRFIKVFENEKIEHSPRQVNKYPFILKDDEKRVLRSKEVIALQAKGLATRLYNSNFDKVVIGISGGLDSTLALFVINEAFNQLNLDKKNIYCFSLPGFGTSDRTFENAKKLIEILGCTYKEIDIKNTSTEVLKALEHPLDVYDVAYENVQARIRTLFLMNYANMENALVVGTGDLSEEALGFMTYNGDHMSMYAVNISIPKTLVKILVNDYKFIHNELKEVIESILDTPISPELVPQDKNKKMQETEVILGKYDLHDFFLYHYFRNSFSKEKIYHLATIAFNDLDKEYIKTTLDTFFFRYFTQQFKRSCMPDGVKVGSVSLSPRGDLRMPSDMSPYNSFNKKN